MLGLNRPIRDRHRSGIWSSVCGGADDRGVVVDGKLRRTAGKSVRYVGELVVS